MTRTNESSPAGGAAQAAPATDWTPAELLARLDGGDPPFLFDVRNEEEFGASPIEGRVAISAANVPYYEMFENDVHDDVVDTFVDYLEGRWRGKLPEDRPIVAVCATGDTSAYVAQALRRIGLDAVNLAGGAAAWGNHYQVRPVAESAGLSIWQIARPARGCLSYLVASDGEAVVVDPLRHVERYAELLAERQVELAAVVDTHAHADHISGGPELARRFGVPYLLHAYDGIHPLDLLPANVRFEHMADGRRLGVGSTEIRVLHIPGHTLGNTALLVGDAFLLSGDSIFLESIARPDLGGRAEAWAPLHHRSLARLLELPPATVVLPGHFSRLAETEAGTPFAAALGELVRRNEDLAMARLSEAEFVDHILASLPDFPEEYVEIKRVNAGLARAGEAKASELELGKNECALARSTNS